MERELDRLLSSLAPPLIGITSLAVGADQLFANAVLRRGGSLEVVIPFAGYERTFSEGRDRQEYTQLLQHALRTEVLEKHGSDEEAYFASGKRMVDQSELLIAVWDGLPATGLGGTGDVVSYALQQRIKTIHLNPITQEVEEL
ncbi:MAG: hypothetical protein M3416_00415 [Acidobacteriota bacterium]|nr:hypothetical protein [Acidobacteriota bacterium]